MNREFLQSQLNQHYDNEEVGESAFELFEFEVASDLGSLTKKQRSILDNLTTFDFEAIVRFIQRCEKLSMNFQYNDMEYDFDEYVVETIGDALVVCKKWDKEKNSQKGGN
jgi:hypothetical protein